jgi:hypothetical protein
VANHVRTMSSKTKTHYATRVLTARCKKSKQINSDAGGLRCALSLRCRVIAYCKIIACAGMIQFTFTQTAMSTCSKEINSCIAC